MELLEADFAQIEHINQILQNSYALDNYACFDTHYLIKAYNDLNKILGKSTKIGTYDAENPKNSRMTAGVKDVRYDFFIVNITKLSNGWKYAFDIRNALWDGSYKITKSKNSSSEADVTFDKSQVLITRDGENENNVVFTITGEDSDRARICFHLNLSGTGRTIKTNSISISTETEFTHQYNETVCEPGVIKYEDGTPVANATVTIEPVDKDGLPITGGIPESSTKTDSKGEFKMCYGAVDTPGDYYVLMTATIDGVKTTKLIHVKKVQERSLYIGWGDADQYKDVIKGCIKKFHIPMHINDEFGVHDTKKDLDKQLLNITFNVSLVKFGNNISNLQTCSVKENKGEYYIEPEISFRDYYENTSRLEIEVPLSSGFGNKKEQHLITHKWFVANDFDDINRELADTNGTDWIFLDAKEYKQPKNSNESPKPLEIKREITIAGLEGDNPCTIDGNNSNIIIIKAPSPATDNYMKVNILGIKFTNSQSAIRQETGSRLLVDHCYFTGNKHDGLHHRGCSIYMPITDETKRDNKLWKTEIRNSRFHNNRGNEIQSIGETIIHDNMFSTTDKVHLQQPEVKVVSVRAGKVTYKNNKSYINIPFKNKSDAMPSNHSYAKALAYVDTNAQFNGKGPASLKGDNTLPLYGTPYNNEAYTRACYYYPYDDVRTYIVCSPKRGHERRATGHASSAKGWVFYDGYYFTRLENSIGNTNNPWSEDEIKLPTNTGIYNLTSNKFIKGYDPRYSKSNSKTSELD